MVQPKPASKANQAHTGSDPLRHRYRQSGAQDCVCLSGEYTNKVSGRACLDHMLVLGVLPLIRGLKEYVAYFNYAPPHQGIGQRMPEATQSAPGKPNAGKVTACPQTGTVTVPPKGGAVIAIPVLNGLHPNYGWAAGG